MSAQPSEEKTAKQPIVDNSDELKTNDCSTSKVDSEPHDEFPDLVCRSATVNTRSAPKITLSPDTTIAAAPQEVRLENQPQLPQPYANLIQLDGSPKINKLTIGIVEENDPTVISVIIHQYLYKNFTVARKVRDEMYNTLANTPGVKVHMLAISCPGFGKNNSLLLLYTDAKGVDHTVNLHFYVCEHLECYRGQDQGRVFVFRPGCSVPQQYNGYDSRQAIPPQTCDHKDEMLPEEFEYRKCILTEQNIGKLTIKNS